MPAAKFEIKRKCQVCRQEFIAKTIESWYCSKRCSNIAYKRRKDEEKRNQRLDEIVKSIPKHQDYIKVSEAYAMFGISKDTLYRLIHKGTISHINLGTNYKTIECNYMATNKNINRIKVVLVEKKKTNKWLADQIGKDQATVSKWCTNTTQPTLETLVETARILEVDIRELLVPTDNQKIMMTIL